MNTTKTAPQRHCSASRKWLAGLMVAASLGCGTAQNHRGTITLSDGRGVPIIILDRNRSDSSIVEMRNYVFALNRILKKMVDRTVDFSRLNERPPFEGALEAVQTARTSQEVADEFAGRCNAALTSEEVPPEEMEFLSNRYFFAHGLLVDAILKFRDRLDGISNVRGIPASLGYPQIDLFGEL